MNIGQAADASGVPAKLIRYYESIGLIPKAGRTPSGYRVYSDRDVHTLRFIKRARALGFQIDEIRILLNLWTGRQPSAEVKKLATEHIRELDRKLVELRSVEHTLRRLIEACQGDERPDCPILEGLDDDPNGRASLANPQSQ
jgi:Cu(I)-responsive transcriptional regulator